MYEDEVPELLGYVPIEGKPQTRHIHVVMRVVVVIGIIALVLPGVVIAAGTASRTANNACSVYTVQSAPQAIGYSARFEFFSPNGVGWNCYAELFDGSEVFERGLGIIPAEPVLNRHPPSG